MVMCWRQSAPICPAWGKKGNVGWQVVFSPSRPSLHFWVSSQMYSGVAWGHHLDIPVGRGLHLWRSQ